MYPTITIGVMSGTSLDGVDAAAVDFANSSPRLLGHHHIDFPQELSSRIASLCHSGPDEIEQMGDIAVELSDQYSRCVQELLAHCGLTASQVAAVGIHGQTVRHRPERGWTLQINNPARVAEKLGIDVVADFRSRDMAAGGEGAPLVPAFHERIFRSSVPRTIVNIGGIANITCLPALENSAAVIGYDCGPGNTLLDYWCKKHTGFPFDKDGRWAATGTPDALLLEKLLAEPYFGRLPPKSTGRELFSPSWLQARIGSQRPQDIEATLVELTAGSIAEAIARTAPQTREVFVCGGGAFNPTLMQAIRRRLPSSMTVASVSVLGIDPLEVESMAFAWLAWAFITRTTGNLPDVTNARGRRILGALYPH